jgi:hypothetical protein
MKQLLSSRTFIFLTGLVALASVRMTAAAPELEFDHVWIVVTRDASERTALERIGLKISPVVNRNDGQGTASVNWRINGWCPIGVALHRTDPATNLPFPTWSLPPSPKLPPTF